MTKTTFYTKNGLRTICWNLQNLGEKIEWNSGDDEARDFPFYIVSAGYSYWGKGARIERDAGFSSSIELVTAGNCTVETNGQQYLIEPGMLFFPQSNQSCSYGTGPAGFLHKRFIAVGGEMANLLFSRLALDTCPLLKPTDPWRFVRTTKAAVALLQARPEGFREMLSRLAYETFLWLKSEFSVQQKFPIAIRKALSFMDQNMHRPLTIEELAVTAAMSESHFFRLFRETLNISPIQYHINQRMQRARQYLSVSHKSIAEIATLCGYDDPAYFSNTFRKATGQSPQTYRSSSCK